jgi:hypothetical protein
VIAAAALLVLVFGPLAVGWASARQPKAPQPAAAAAWALKPTLSSALLYTLAYNLTFLLQELFLVLPKALTPGLHPTLFHNNHTWSGDNPLASLLQGSGALAILLSGLACGIRAHRPAPRSWSGQLLLVWMAYHGCFQALPQVVVGALIPESDVGMAMAYLHLPAAVRSAAALAALALMPLIALWLTPCFLALAGDAVQLASPKARLRRAFALVTLPALLGLVLTVPFRVPRELTEVLLPPLFAVLAGIGWVQALAARVPPPVAWRSAPEESLVAPLSALAALLLLFQLVLRRGIAFY